MWGNAMKATVNREILNAAVFDSGSLGVLASVIHQFKKIGRYQAVVSQKGKRVGAIGFEVVENGPTQLDIDLSAVSSAGARKECDCSNHGRHAQTVSAEGFVLFHVGAGMGGYSVVVGEDRVDAKPVFDSQNLMAGDLFALSLVEPTHYTMANRHGSAKGEIIVAFDAAIAKRITVLKQETQYVDVKRDSFQPDKVSLAATQGLVFRITDRARIIVAKSRPAARERDKRSPRRIRPLKRR